MDGQCAIRGQESSLPSFKYRLHFQTSHVRIFVDSAAWGVVSQHSPVSTTVPARGLSTQ